MIQEVKSEKKPDIKKIAILSNHLSIKFYFDKHCRHCWGRGVEATQLTPTSDIIYTPCICVRAKN